MHGNTPRKWFAQTDNVRARGPAVLSLAPSWTATVFQWRGQSRTAFWRDLVASANWMVQASLTSFLEQL